MHLFFLKSFFHFTYSFWLSLKITADDLQYSVCSCVFESSQETKATAAQVQACNSVLDRLNKLCRQASPLNGMQTRIEVIGSFASGLAETSSDMDLIVLMVPIRPLPDLVQEAYGATMIRHIYAHMLEGYILGDFHCTEVKLLDTKHTIEIWFDLIKVDIGFSWVDHEEQDHPHLVLRDIVRETLPSILRIAPSLGLHI